MRNIRTIVIALSLAVALSFPMVVQVQLAEGAPPGKPFENPWIDVRTYGAKGDGVTNDTTAIQNALEDATLSKTIVFFPAGDYKITNALDIFEGQTLFGVGNGTKLIASTKGQTILNLKGSQIQIRGMFLTTESGVTDVIGVYVNPNGDVHANFNKLHSLRIEGPATGIVIQGGRRIDGADMGAWYNSLVDINIRFVTDGVTLTGHPSNLENGANGTRAYNVRVGADCATGWRIIRADTAHVFGFAAEGCTTGVHIEDSPGADNNGNVFFGPRFEGTTTDIQVDANSFFNGFIGFTPDTKKIIDNDSTTLFLGTTARIQFDGLSYSDVDAMTKLNALNGVSIMNNDGVGTLGIGTTNPQQELDIVGGLRLSTGYIYRPDNAGVAVHFGDGIGTFLQNTHDFKDASGSQLWMTITQGDVGIGTASPTEKLHVVGNVLANSFIQSSDARLKTDVTKLSNVLEKLQQVRGVSFTWNEAAETLGYTRGQRDIGVIAQELETVFPELVISTSHTGYKAVDYGKLASILIVAVKELREENEALERRLTTLEQAFKTHDTHVQLSSFGLPSGWLLFGGLFWVGLMLIRYWVMEQFC
jgi:Chaperone of endosialidase/Pectate lyase superfamily protein